MKQENIKKVMEQIRSKKNGNDVANEQTAMAEGNVNATTMATARAGVDNLVERTITVPANAITIQSFVSPTFQGIGTLVVSDTAIAGRKDNLYHYAMCSIDLRQATDLANVLNENKKVSLNIDALQYEGTDVCVFLTQTQTLFTWEDGREIVFEVNAAKVNENVMFIVAPATPQSNGYITFTPADMTFSYALTSINISKPSTKTVYLERESFDPSGMEVTATYSDGSTETVTDYTMSVSGFNSDNVTDSQTVTINVTLGNCTASYNLTISVDELKHEDAPYVRGSSIQKMDIHIPDNLGENERVPAVITIHGGSWSGGDKGGYNYMTEFLTQNCGCVHVNMNYRLTKNEDNAPTGFTYEEMLDDIQSAIGYLQSHHEVYHINPNKIALMGHSAGGHLALLYAYSTAENYTNSEDNPIKLVISEAGPTDFLVKDSNGNLILPDSNVCAMAGVMNNDSETDKAGKLTDASPLTYVTSSAPYTILAYGDQLDTQGQTEAGDGMIPYAQATALAQKLNNNNVQYDLKRLIKVWHGDFGKAVHYDMTQDKFNQRRDEYLETVSCENHASFSNSCSACQQKRNAEMNRYTYIWNTQLSNINAYYDAIRNNL